MVSQIIINAKAASIKMILVLALHRTQTLTKMMDTVKAIDKVPVKVLIINNIRKVTIKDSMIMVPSRNKITITHIRIKLMTHQEIKVLRI